MRRKKNKKITETTRIRKRKDNSGMYAGISQEADMNGTTVNTTGTGRITVEEILKERITQWKEPEMTAEKGHVGATTENASAGVMTNKTKNKICMDRDPG